MEPRFAPPVRLPRIPSISELPLSESETRRFQGCEFIHQPNRRPAARTSWSQAEDKKLLTALQGQEDVAWEAVAARVGHTAKQCRERWLVKLNPDVRRSHFEKWEDELIRAERQRIGNHWSLIAQLFPGRTACSIKNRWYTVLRYQESSHPFMCYWPQFPIQTELIQGEQQTD
jgi:hypothetical protein